MSELLTQLDTAVRQIVDRDSGAVLGHASRDALLHGVDTQLRVVQHKSLSPKELLLARRIGIARLATRTWFNDIAYIEDTSAPTAANQLDMTIESSAGQVYEYASQPSAVPKGDEALQQYNQYYRQYMHVLHTADAAISYHRTWSNILSNRRRAKTVVNGMRLASLATDDVIYPGWQTISQGNETRLTLMHDKAGVSMFGTVISIFDKTTVKTKSIWGDADRPQIADEELLETAFKLVDDVASVLLGSSRTR